MKESDNVKKVKIYNSKTGGENSQQKYCKIIRFFGILPKEINPIRYSVTRWWLR
jgi:hypothetical protein